MYNEVLHTFYIVFYSSLCIYCIADILAQAACISLQSRSGWMYAIRRYCGQGSTCKALCKASVSKSDNQVLIPKIKILIAQENQIQYFTFVKYCIENIYTMPTSYQSLFSQKIQNSQSISKVWVRSVYGKGEDGEKLGSTFPRVFRQLKGPKAPILLFNILISSSSYTRILFKKSTKNYVF